jgi:DNA-binding transcriptional regulator YdaS (Cro superfamily)
MAVRKWIASQLGISEVYVRSMCSGNKPIPAKYALRIEKITDGAVPKHVTAPEPGIALIIIVLSVIRNRVRKCWTTLKKITKK